MRDNCFNFLPYRRSLLRLPVGILAQAFLAQATAVLLAFLFSPLQAHGDQLELRRKAWRPSDDAGPAADDARAARSDRSR